MPLTNHIAIYGGSFNPPHIGHEIACMWLTEALSAKEVIIAPTYKHYFGKNLIHFAHRLEMCKRMAITKAFDIKVSEAEAHLPQPNTTLNLLKFYRIWYPDSPFAVVVGSDLLPDLHKWHQWNEVADMAKIIVVGRSGNHTLALPPFEVHQYPIELSAVSSSEIRKRLSKDQDITGLVSRPIKQYILENDLYGR